MYEPDHQKAEHAGEDPIGKEMGAGRHAQDSDGSPEGDRRCISECAPRRRDHGGARQSPERARRLARDKGAILRAVAAWIPPGAEVLVAAEFGHVDWARATPVLLEHEIGDDPR